jgi:hypothetical protein
MVRLGIPLTISYSGLKKRAFWRTYERLALQQLNLHLDSQILLAFAHRSVSMAAGVHALPGITSDQLEKVVAEATQSVREYAKTVKPWLKDSDLSSEEETKRQLLDQSEEMIEAFLAVFEPHNLEAYRKEREQRLTKARAEDGQ